MSAALHVVDDEPRMGEILAMVLRKAGHEVSAWTSPRAFLAAVDSGEPCDLLLTDLKMDEMDGLGLLGELKTRAPGVPVVLITAHATVRTAVEAVQRGAFDYVQKPFDNDACRALVARALAMSALGRENRALRAALDASEGRGRIVAESEVMQDALDLAWRAAASDSTVLIEGESGTGKELVARAIHLASPRVKGPFVAVNVRAFADTLLESELFGHEKGAFTGADRARPGVFERARGGSLFLDEVGELSADAQTKLLRVIQEREVTRVGGERPIALDVRLLTATWRDLEEAVRDGDFRQDLYYRLAVIPVRLPPLRERRDDVLPIARRVLAQLAERLDRPLLSLSAAAEDALVAHDWPGNVRELENALDRAAVLARDDRLEPADLRLATGEGTVPSAADPANASHEDSDLNLHAWLDTMAARRVQEALVKTGGKRARAAALLGVERTTLYRLMKKYDIDNRGDGQV